MNANKKLFAVFKTSIGIMNQHIDNQNKKYSVNYNYSIIPTQNDLGFSNGYIVTSGDPTQVMLLIGYIGQYTFIPLIRVYSSDDIQI